MTLLVPEYIFPLLAYLIGSFPTGVVLTKRKYGIDVREMGSGNIGATNVTRVFGWWAGILVFLIDFLKGLLPLYFLKYYFSASGWLLAIVGTALVLGHCFSVFLKGRGGKGVATSLGCLTVTAPWAAAGAATLYAILLVSTRISALGSLVGIWFVVAYAVVKKPPMPVQFLIIAISCTVLFRHKSNIQRLWQDFQTKRGGK